MMIAGSFFILHEPENRKQVSADGVVTVVGAMRQQDLPFMITPRMSPGLPLVGAVYNIKPEDHIFDFPVTLTFTKKPMTATESITTVYWWNARFGMWEVLPSVLVNTQEKIIFTTAWLGDFSLGHQPRIEMPGLFTLFDALRQKAPEGARGYHFVVAYRLPNGPYVRWPEIDEIGGCDGAPGGGNTTEYSSTSMTITVLVDDVFTPIDILGVAEWTVSGDHSSCPQEELFGARQE